MIKNFQTISFAEEDNSKKVSIDFRIRSDILRPQEISNQFGILPTKAWAKGEKFQSKRRDPKTKQVCVEWRERPWGMWHLDTENLVSELKVEKHILYLLDRLEPKKSQLAEYLERQNDYSISFYIHWEPLNDWGSYELDSSLLSRMSTLCHYVEFAFIGSSS